MAFKKESRDIEHHNKGNYESIHDMFNTTLSSDIRRGNYNTTKSTNKIRFKQLLQRNNDFNKRK